MAALWRIAIARAARSARVCTLLNGSEAEDRFEIIGAPVPRGVQLPLILLVMRRARPPRSYQSGASCARQRATYGEGEEDVEQHEEEKDEVDK